MKRVLVVCLGNICRSPIGEELIREHAQLRGVDVTVDSAGTMGWHAGKAPDPRSQLVMRAHGLDISMQQSRPLTASDFYNFDIILCMDHQNLMDAHTIAPGPAQLSLFVADKDVPDPYYGGDDGFEKVHAMLNAAAGDWMNQWSQQTNS